ncbi:MAG: tRNA lysidine(34) synthetase TilS [Bryobacteraceae bacterium]
MFARGDRVGVAVSGGPDSIALLRALQALRSRWEIELTVLHVNHGLRGAESVADERFVHNTAQELGVEFRAARVATESAGGNLEERARESRYEFFRESARVLRLDRVATGHTLDDQAETVVFRLLRGTGMTGLAGIRAVTREGIVRPLIELREREVRAWLTSIGQPWREDSSNESPAFARNRIRKQVLPMLESWNPQVPEGLAHVAGMAALQDDYIGAEAERWSENVLKAWCGGVVVDLPALGGAPPALRGRILRIGIGRARGDLRGIDWRHMRTVEHLAQEAKGRGSASLPGLRVVRSFERLLLIGPGELPGRYRYEAGQLRDGDWVELAGRRLRLGSDAGQPDSSYNTGGRRFDRINVRGQWELRSWMPGDRFHPLGSGEPKKLKHLFQLARIPSWERPSWPIISDEGRVVWVSGFGPAADAGQDRDGPWRPIGILEEREGIGELGGRIGTAVNSEPKPERKASEEVSGSPERPDGKGKSELRKAAR